MAKRSKRRSRRVVAACLDQIWAIEHEKLGQICGFLELRESGYQLSESEILETMAYGVVDDDDEAADDDDESVRIKDGVGFVQMLGVMSPRMNMLSRFSGGTSTYQLAASIDALGNNPDVNGVIIEIDSPGGIVTGTEELSQSIASAAMKKRVVALARGQMASAAYYAGSAATEVIATPSTSVGSIGVYAIHSERSKLAERRGVSYRVFRAGEFKAAGNEYEKLTDKMAETIQARIDAPYRQFVQAVADNRNVSDDVVEAKFGQGQSFLADEAMRRGMIDRVALFDDVVAEEMVKSEKLQKAAKPPTVVVYVPKFQYANESAGNVIAVSESGLVPDDDVVSIAATAAASKEDSMDPKVRAALVARGIIKADATDEQATAALDAVFASRGETVPEGTDDIVSAILKPAVAAVEPAVESPADDSSGSENATLVERNRIQDLQARGELLGVSADDVASAVNDNISADAASGRWTDAMVAANRPVTGTVESGESEVDRVFASAESVIGQRLGLAGDPLPAARDMQRLHPVDIARQCIRASGGRINGDAETDALAFLQLGGTDRQTFNSEAFAAEGVSYNRAGAFPNLMSSLAGKILDAGFEMADATYPQWCAKMSDAADLKPRILIAAGVFSDLDLIMDDDMPEDLPLTEELMSWITVDRYANKVGLTPVMIANDDLDAFSTQLSSLAYAHEAKVNALCVGAVGANPTMADGTALFAGITSDHWNLIASGVVVSSTALAAMRTAHRMQPGVGTSKKIKAPPKICLVPPGQEENALQALAPLATFADGAKTPITDATINTSRGHLKVVVENDLVDYSTTAWYTLANPAVRRAIVYCFQRGYGRGGQRETWFENGRKTRYVALEGRFAAAAASWRGIVKNPGA